MSSKVFVVTGANKGIGYGIVRKLAENVNGAIVYLTSRNEDLGQSALKKLKEELGDKQKSEILYHQLDITNQKSCETFSKYLKEKYGGIDVLINNAGFAFHNDATEPAEVQAQVTIDINYYGTKLVSAHLQPIIRDGGRVVNVCSQAGILKKLNFTTGGYSAEWVKYLSNPNVTEKEIDDFVEAYKTAAKNGNRVDAGFPESAYRVSKAAEVAYTLHQSKLLKSRNITVNACCPGFVDTDMTNHKGPLTITEGADTPVYLAIDPSVPNGEFFFQRKVLPWY